MLVLTRSMLRLNENKLLRLDVGTESVKKHALLPV